MVGFAASRGRRRLVGALRGGSVFVRIASTVAFVLAAGLAPLEAQQAPASAAGARPPLAADAAARDQGARPPLAADAAARDQGSRPPLAADAAARDQGSGELTPLGQASPADGQAAQERLPLVSTWDFVRMLLVLGAVIAVIYVLFLLLRRISRRKTAENDLITVLGSKSLAANRTLHLVRVGRCVYLVGASEGGVRLVAEIADREAADELVLAAESSRATAKRTFSDLLGSIVPQGGLGGVSLPEGLGFVRRQRDRLRKLRSV